MNQIIKMKTISFTELVKQHTLELSPEAQSDMIDLLTKEFTEEQFKRYVINLYMFLNFDPTTDFPVSLDHVYRDLGFANKGNALKTIKSNFTKELDYKIILVPREKKQNAGRPEDEIIKTSNKTHEDCLLVRTEKQTNRGGHNQEEIMLNIDTYKTLCMLVKTPQGKMIRRYYVKLENIYNKIVKMEIETTKTLLEMKDKELIEQKETIEQLEMKPELEGFIRKSGYIYIVIDTSISIKDTGHIKLGSCGDDKIDTRLSQLNVSSSTNSLKLLKKFKTFDVKFVEEMIHSALNPLKIRNRKEWFYFSNKLELNYIINTIENCIEFINVFNIKNNKQFEQKIKRIKYKNKDEMNEDQNNKINENKGQDQDQVNEMNKDKDQVNEDQDQVNEMNKDKDQVNEYQVNEGQVNIKIKSKYIGLTWTKSKNKWKSSLTYKQKNYHLGYFKEELEAVKTYNDYACYINETYQLKKNYELNNIENYISKARNIPYENKNLNHDNKTSKYIGVHFVKSRNNYNASISVNGKSISIASGKTEIEAAKIYNQQALFYNNINKTKYKLNEIDGFIIEPKDIKTENENIKKENKTSKYIGVIWAKDISSWKSLVVYNKKCLRLGLFTNETEAAKVYNEQALFLNNEMKTKYKLNDIPNFITKPKNIYNDKYKNKLI